MDPQVGVIDYSNHVEGVRRTPEGTYYAFEAAPDEAVDQLPNRQLSQADLQALSRGDYRSPGGWSDGKIRLWDLKFDYPEGRYNLRNPPAHPRFPEKVREKLNVNVHHPPMLCSTSPNMAKSDRQNFDCPITATQNMLGTQWPTRKAVQRTTGVQRAGMIYGDMQEPGANMDTSVQRLVTRYVGAGVTVTPANVPYPALVPQPPQQQSTGTIDLTFSDDD